MAESHGDWRATLANGYLAQMLSARFGVRGIPALVVLDASDGSVLARDGKRDVQAMGAGAFAHWESQAGAGVEEVDVSAVEALRDNPEEVRREAGEILVRLLRNVQRNPSDLRFRAVKLSNPTIESKLLGANGAFEILFSVGFEEVTTTNSALAHTPSSPSLNGPFFTTVGRRQACAPHVRADEHAGGLCHGHQQGDGSGTVRGAGTSLRLLLGSGRRRSSSAAAASAPTWTSWTSWRAGGGAALQAAYTAAHQR